MRGLFVEGWLLVKKFATVDGMGLLKCLKA